MAVRCKEMTERLRIIEDQEIEAIEAIDGGLEFELAACNLEPLNKVGRPGSRLSPARTRSGRPWRGSSDARAARWQGTAIHLP
jgi:hypothetical protein